MVLTPCECGRHNHLRVHRSWWMRLVVGRRQFFCVRCGQTMLLPKPVFPSGRFLGSELTASRG